jgi:hypothetical protein
MFLIIFYVPVPEAELVKRALFEAGAGRIGDYQECSWEVLGEGQFRPMEGSASFLGKEGEVERVAELRVEMVVEEPFIDEVVKALLEAHPYEEPAYHVLKTDNY